MRVLVVGSEGFVGSHIAQELRDNGHEAVCTSLEGGPDGVALDIMDQARVERVLGEVRPDALVNAAGQASVARSWESPQDTVMANTVGALNILEAVRAVDPGVRVVAMGSSDEYGPLGARGRDVKEDEAVCPQTPYAVSKVAQAHFIRLYHQVYGMDVCLMRCFNLAGAGQPKGFMIPDFASGIVDVERGRSRRLRVGNLQTARDYTHVRDAARACRLIVEGGRPGETYHVCSGRAYTGREVLERLCDLSCACVEVEQDECRLRPNDTPIIRGNHDRLTRDTGWSPVLGMDDIVREVLEYWRARG